MKSNLTISDVVIRKDDKERYCLNDIHKASKASKNKSPPNWVRNKSTQELVQEVKKLNGISTPLRAKTNGNFRGTYADELLVLAYALWINPRFQLHVFQVFSELRARKVKVPLQLSRKDILQAAFEDEQVGYPLEHSNHSFVQFVQSIRNPVLH